MARCETHCPQEGSGVLAALAMVAAVAAAAWVLSLMMAAIVAAAVAILAACAVGSVAVAWLIRHGSVSRRHRAPAPPRMRAPRQKAITTGQKAIEGTIVPGWTWRHLAEDAAKEEARHG